MKPLIYVCEDEKVILDTLCTFLNAHEFEAIGFERAIECLEAYKHKPCDCLITDVNMPEMNGFELLQHIRLLSHVPIIILTARDSDLDFALGIHSGADDYVTKPFSTLNVVLRVKALLQRVELDKSQNNQDSVTFHSLFMDPKKQLATINGIRCDFTPMEFALVLYLTRHAQQAIPREVLLKKVWGYDTLSDTRACDDTIRRVRKKLMHSNITIETVWGYGFRITVQEV